MAGKSTYADLVKKTVASVSPEPVDKPESLDENVQKRKAKPTESAKPKEAFPSLINGGKSLTNGHSNFKSVPALQAPVLPKAEKQIESEIEPQDDTGFKLVKPRERKHSTSSRQSGNGNYRNSSRKPSSGQAPRRNQRMSESGQDSAKKMSFDERRDEEKLKFLKRFPKKESLCFEVRSGDVFSSKADVSLAHCVSEDLEAKDGVSKEFKEQFGNTEDLLAQNVKTGGCANLECLGRYIFYLVTRQFSFHRPYYSSLEKSLKEMRKQCGVFGVTELAMPIIGNRQDQLDWDLVARIVDSVFSGSGINLTVFKYRSERRGQSSSGRGRKRTDE